jgi:hypothetical protein
VQAVHVPAKKWTGISFFQADSIKIGTVTVKVDRPCVLALQENAKDWTVYAGDPLNTNGNLNVTIQGVMKTLAFRTGNMSGSTVIGTIAKPAPPVSIPSLRVPYDRSNQWMSKEYDLNGRLKE